MKNILLMNILFAVIFNCMTAYAEIIAFRSDYYCPYVCDPDSSHPGYIVEILRAIYVKEGLSISVKITDWARSIHEVRGDIAQGLIGASKNEAKDLVYPSKTVGKKKSAYFIRNESTWMYEDSSTLLNSKIGVINGHYYGESLDRFVKMRHQSFKPFAGARPLDQITSMLLAGHLDVFVENATIVHHLMSQKNPTFEHIKHAGWVSNDEIPLFVGFSRKNTKAKYYAQILSKGLDELRLSGELQKILTKYNLTDWDPPHPKLKQFLSSRRHQGCTNFINMLSTGGFKDKVDPCFT